MIPLSSATEPGTRLRVVAAFAAFGAWWGAWGAVLAAVQRASGVGDGALGIALLFVGVGALVAMRIAGGLVDRHVGRVLGPAMVGLTVVGIGPGLVRGAVPLAATMFLLGAVSGAVDVAINAEASRVEVAGRRPVLNLAHAAFSLAVIAGSLAAGGLRSAGASAAGALAVVGVVVALVGLWSGAGEVPAGRPPPGVTGWRWFRPPLVLLQLGLLLALAFFVESVWQTWSAVHLERDLGAGAGLAAVGPAVFGASAGAGRLLAHRASRRVGHGPAGRGEDVGAGDRRLIAGGAALATVGTLMAAGLPSVVGVLAGIAAAGLGTAACAPALLGLAGRVAGEGRRGAAVGTVTTLGYLGFVLAPAAVGVVAELATLPAALAGVALVAAALGAGTLRTLPAGEGPAGTAQ